MAQLAVRRSVRKPWLMDKVPPQRVSPPQTAAVLEGSLRAKVLALGSGSREGRARGQGAVIVNQNRGPCQEEFALPGLVVVQRLAGSIAQWRCLGERHPQTKSFGGCRSSKP